MLTICNEPVQPLAAMRSPRIWQNILAPDLPGKIVHAQIQLNHGLVDEERTGLEKRLLDLYKRVITRFGALHGESTRCFIVRVPESINLVGHHIREFGGATNGLACFETVFVVSPRSDSKVTIAHVEDSFAGIEFELSDGLPRARVLDWEKHLKDSAQKFAPAGAWAGAIRRAVQYYVNRHKGPTGQIELPIPGMNIVVGTILPAGLSSHSNTTLAAASLVALMALTGEWGQLPLSEFAAWLSEAEAGSHGRRSEIGPLVFGMPGEIVHVDFAPARAKSKPLAHGFSFIVAHTGVKPDCAHDAPKPVDVLKTPALRSTTSCAALALFRQLVKSDGALWLSDEGMYDLLRQVPERASRSEILKRISGEGARAELQRRFANHEEPPGGYNLREKLLYVLAEMRRAQNAADVIRSGDPLRLAALMNISQSGESTTCNEVNSLGQVQAAHALPGCVSDEEMQALGHACEPLWRQTGRSGASTLETDLLCDIAMAAPGVLAARYCEPQRIVILCKSDYPQMVLDCLQAAYYQPRGFSAPLAEQVFPCQGAGILAV